MTFCQYDLKHMYSQNIIIVNGPYTEEALHKKYILNLRYKDVLNKSFGDEDITKALEIHGIKLPLLQQKEKKS
jgi:hypothetical protein